MADNERNDRGQFIKGCSGGPGRPSRPIELQYLGALSDEVSLSDWHEIVAKARDDARGGCWRSREWLSRYLVGIDSPPSLVDLAAAENGTTAAVAAGELVAERALMLSAGRLMRQRDTSEGEVLGR